MHRVSVPVNDYYQHLQGYQAQFLAEYSNGKRHVYWSAPMKRYITARRQRDRMELEFTPDCPCSYED